MSRPLSFQLLDHFLSMESIQLHHGKDVYETANLETESKRHQLVTNKGKKRNVIEN